MRLVLAYVLLSLGSLWALFPFVWMILTSLKSESQVLIYPPAWIPSPVVWGNYAEVTRLLPSASFTARTLLDVRRRGWAHSVAEREPGVASLSAPVRDATGGVLGAVSISGPVERLGRRPSPEIIGAVLDAASAISRAAR